MKTNNPSLPPLLKGRCEIIGIPVGQEYLQSLTIAVDIPARPLYETIFSDLQGG